MSTSRPVKTVLDVVTVGAKAVGDAGLLPPGVSLIVGVVNAIVKNCEQVKLHQQECRQLSHKVEELYTALKQQTERLERTPLYSSVEEVKLKLEVICDRTSIWASYGFLRAFMHDSNIADGLKASIKEVDSLLQLFHLDMETYLVQVVTAILEKVNTPEEKKQRILPVVVQAVEDPEKLKELDQETLQEVEPTLHTVIDHMESKSKAEDLTMNGQSINRIAFNQIYLRAQEGILEVHKIIDLPPGIQSLNGLVDKTGPNPYAGGIVSDIYKGVYKKTHKVAIKSLRNVEVATERETRRFENELAVWRRLHHPNILNFLGICTDLGEKISLISDWMEGNDLYKYCCNNTTNADRLKLLIDAARGVQYLHQQHIVHGNLKCSKILIYVPDPEKDPTGVVRALVSDFQMSRILDEIDAQHSVTMQTSARWLAPEYTTAGSALPSADVYSFSMTMYECCTLLRPFNHKRREAEVMSYVASGGRPERPKAGENTWITGKVWKVMEDGWAGEAEKRPTMDEVVAHLEICYRERQSFMG